jgi:hypothetical protein
VERLAIGARRRRLEEWLGRELSLRFEGGMLPVDADVADAWGKIVARSEATDVRSAQWRHFLRRQQKFII